MGLRTLCLLDTRGFLVRSTGSAPSTNRLYLSAFNLGHYIYLALNDEIECNQDFNEDSLPTPCSIWAPLIHLETECDRATHLPLEQPDDTDSTFQPYQGFFYL